MVRLLPIKFSGALYHSTPRGDRREAMDEEDDDR